MASSVTLRCEFYDASGNTITFAFKNADAEAETQEVVALMNAIIANGSIFAKVPATKKAAYMRVTTDEDYDIS